MGARVFQIVLGLWLLVSTWLMPQGQAASLNGLICGVLCIAFAAVSIKVPVVKYANTALGLWLFFTAFAFGGMASTTVWNQAIVASGIFVFSLAPVETEVPLFRMRWPRRNVHV
jgi:hypothetical protein